MLLQRRILKLDEKGPKSDVVWDLGMDKEKKGKLHEKTIEDYAKHLLVIKYRYRGPL
jgi:hypothetical protein